MEHAKGNEIQKDKKAIGVTMEQDLEYKYKIYEQGREKEDGYWRFETEQDAKEWLESVSIDEIKHERYNEVRYFVREGNRGGTIYSFPTREKAEQFVKSLVLGKI